MSDQKNLASKIAYGSFYFAVITEVLMVLIDKSAYTNPIEGRLFQLTFLLFFIKVCLTRYSFREYLIAALFLALGVISYLVTGRNEKMSEIGILYHPYRLHYTDSFIIIWCFGNGILNNELWKRK